MLRRMIVPKKREQPKSTGSSDTSVYRRSEEAEAAILPGQPWFFRDCTEQPVQMKTDSHVIQMASPEQKQELKDAIEAYRGEEQGARDRLTRAVQVDPDAPPRILRANFISHSLVYEWKIGDYILRGHVHYGGFQDVEMGPVPGHAWIEGVKDFDFLLPSYIPKPSQAEADGLFADAAAEAAEPALPEAEVAVPEAAEAPKPASGFGFGTRVQPAPPGRGRGGRGRGRGGRGRGGRG